MKYRLLFIVASLALFQGCSDDVNELTEEDKATLLIAKTWVTGTVLLDGVDITDFGYRQTELTFMENRTWTALNGGDIFSNNGAWSFTNQNFTQINISGVTASITINPQGQNLRLVLTITDGPIGGRVGATNGEYTLFLLPKYPPD